MALNDAQILQAFKRTEGHKKVSIFGTLEELPGCFAGTRGAVLWGRKRGRSPFELLEKIIGG